MKKLLKTLNATLLASTLTASNMLSGGAYALTQGTLGAQSTGSIDISVVKTTEVRISGLSDAHMSLAAWHVGDGAVNLYSPACIYSSTASASYKITATGDGDDGAGTNFTIYNAGHTRTIAYAVVWNTPGYAGPFANSGDTLTSGTQSANTYTNASPDSSDCSGGAHSGVNTRVNVNITGAAMTAAPADTYTGILTLLIDPV